MEEKVIEVVFLGYIKRVDGTSFMIVNEVDGHSTVTYNKEKHILVEKKLTS